MLATQDPALAGVIVKTGVYDFPAWWGSRGWFDPIKLAVALEIGWPSREKLVERSAAFFAERIRAPPSQAPRLLQGRSRKPQGRRS